MTTPKCDDTRSVDPGMLLPFPLGVMFQGDKAIPYEPPRNLLADVVGPLLEQCQALARAGQHAMLSPDVADDCHSIARAFELLAEHLQCVRQLVKLCAQELSPATPAGKGGESCT